MQYSKIILISALVATFGIYLFWPFMLDAPIPEKILSLSFFFTLIYCTGYSITRGVKFTQDLFELHIMRAGIGLACLPLLIVALDTISMPIHWIILLLVSLSYPFVNLYKSYKSRGFSGAFNDCLDLVKLPTITQPGWDTLAAVIISCIVFSIALAGSFSYPYLEDGDSWEHAVGIKYISVSRTYLKPMGVYVSHYLPPYPPTYDAILALVHQLNTHLQWTMKAFNALMIGLTILFAYYFTREFTTRPSIAVFSIIFLAVIPAFGSHTIWSHTLGIACLYVIFYSIAKLWVHSSFTNLSIILIASGMITQPLVSMVIGILYLLYILGNSAYTRKDFSELVRIGILGLILSMIYWIPSVVDYGLEMKNIDRVGGGSPGPQLQARIV
ncbi:hypothetical protein ACFLRF_06650 [Candidatus Altiarchaeota archaeon]